MNAFPPPYKISTAPVSVVAAEATAFFDSEAAVLAIKETAALVAFAEASAPILFITAPPVAAAPVVADSADVAECSGL